MQSGPLSVKSLWLCNKLNFRICPLLCSQHSLVKKYNIINQSEIIGMEETFVRYGRENYLVKKMGTNTNENMHVMFEGVAFFEKI